MFNSAAIGSLTGTGAGSVGDFPWLPWEIPNKKEASGALVLVSEPLVTVLMDEPPLPGAEEPAPEAGAEAEPEETDPPFRIDTAGEDIGGVDKKAPPPKLADGDDARLSVIGSRSKKVQSHSL
jgi:hypothetical protein